MLFDPGDKRKKHRAALPDSNWVMPSDLPDLPITGRVALDVETHDPDLLSKGPGVRRGSETVGVAIGIDNGPRRYFPIRHAQGNNLDPGIVLRWLGAWSKRFKGELCGANLLYDLDFLAAEGVVFPLVSRFLDVQVAEPLIDENRTSYALGALSKDYLGTPKDESILEQAAAYYGVDPKSGLWQMPAQYVGAYAEADVDLPLRIIEQQLPVLEQEGLTELFNMESKLIPMLLAMRQRGVRVDIPRAEIVEAKMAAEEKTLQEQLNALAKQRVDVWASTSIAKAFDHLGLTYPRTAKGAASFTKPWLNAQVEDLPRMIAAVRRLDKARNTFLKGHILGHHINGRIHCQFNQLRGDDWGTVTGRFSSSNPNLQQIPARDEEMSALVRGIFVPEPGEIWERLDWSQIEYRFLVHYASGRGADEARAAYNDDPATDFHAMCAKMAGISDRKQVKNINFGVTYGAGAPTVAATMGVTIEEAREFLGTYHQRLPFVKATFERAMRTAAKRGYVKSFLGRRRRFNKWESSRGREKALPLSGAVDAYGEVKRAHTYAALNSVLQPSAADLMKRAMVDVWESGVCDVLGAPLLTVHDELAFSRPQSKAGEEALVEVKHIMENCLELRVPIYAVRESGPSWGEVK